MSTPQPGDSADRELLRGRDAIGDSAEGEIDLV